MEKYNYYEAVKADIAEYIKNEISAADYIGRREDLEEELNETLWTCDSVTGNGSGSYTFNTWKAEENLAHNWDEIETVAAEFGMEPIISDGYENGAEMWDVRIRCYYLYEAVSAVLDEMEAAGAFDEIETAASDNTAA